jgi:hypothetical protein
MGPLTATVPFELLGAESVASFTLAVFVLVSAVPGLFLALHCRRSMSGPCARRLRVISARKALPGSPLQDDHGSREAVRVPRGRRKTMTTMTARPGDRLVVRSMHVGEHVRDAEILEVKHEDGSPPYVVRWSDTGHEGLVFPGPDAFVEHADRDPSGG